MSALGGTEFLVLQVGLAIFVSMLFGAVFEKLKQSAIIGYILGGIILGPQVLGLIVETQVLTLFSELGVLILMFYIGLELDVKKLREAGFVPFVLGPAKMIVCFGLGFFTALFFGFNSLEAALIGLIISMSSTAIIGKYLIDNNLSKSLETSISIPMLLVEDFIAVIALALLSAVGGQHGIDRIVLNSLFFVIVCIFVIANYSKYFIALMSKLAYEKHMALYSVGIALIMAFGAQYFGLSPAIGAFFGGFLLSELKQIDKIKGELETFRNFFVAFFFIAIGLAFTIPNTMDSVVSSLVLGLIILAIYIFGEIAVYGVIGKFLGLDLKFSVYLANLMIPIGEFSLLIAGLAISLNVPHSSEIVNLAIFLTASSAFVTPYFINSSHAITNGIRAIVPNGLKRKIALLQNHFSGISLGMFSNQFVQKEFLDGLRGIGINLFAIFASIYLTLIVQSEFEQPLFDFISNGLLFSIIGAIIVFPVFFNILKEIRKVVKTIVNISAPNVFPALSLNQLKRMGKSLADLFIGVFFLLLTILSLVFTNFLDVIYTQIPVVLTAFAIYFTARGLWNSYYQSKAGGKIGIDSKTIMGFVSRIK